MRTHVISEEPDRLWSLAIIFSAAAFFAAFFELPVAGETSHSQRSRSDTKAVALAETPLGDPRTCLSQVLQVTRDGEFSLVRWASLR